ncbi:MAG: hypothetical protein ACFNL2_09360, partial [Tannerella forsythia]|uniref:hypothetical protein n=1 Tax=Tannerella forsythia TaxID=28112 RepID=UPI003615A98D
LFGDTSNLFGDMSCPKTDCPKKYVFLLIVVLRYGEHKTAKKVSGMKIYFSLCTFHDFFIGQ